MGRESNCRGGQELVIESAAKLDGDSCEVGLIDTNGGCQDSACCGGSRIPGVQVFKRVFVHTWRLVLQRHVLVFFGGAMVLWVLGCEVHGLR